MCGYGVQLPKPASPRADWLIDPGSYKAKIEQKGTEEVVLTNGLVRRVLRLSPNVATVAFDNLSSGESLLRGVKPEARLTLNGKEYAVGGLTGQPDYAYLRPEWIAELRTIRRRFSTGEWKSAGSRRVSRGNAGPVRPIPPGPRRASL
jgi:hypothetical protein